MEAPVTRIEFETLKEIVRGNSKKMDIIIRKLNDIEDKSYIPPFQRSTNKRSLRRDRRENEPMRGEDRIIMQGIKQKDEQGKEILNIINFISEHFHVR